MRGMEAVAKHCCVAVNKKAVLSPSDTAMCVLSESTQPVGTPRLVVEPEVT